MNPDYWQLSLASCLLWTERLLAFSLALQSLELLQLRRQLADDGVWRWQLLKPEHVALPWPLRQLFAVVLPYRGFVGLLLSRLVLAGLLGAGFGWAALPLFFSQLAVCVRFRGTFNGGSDYISMVVLLALAVAALVPASPLVLKACLAYVCVQLLLSYWIAGVVKLVRPSWRRGEALSAFLSSGRYGAPGWLARVGSQRSVAVPATWAVLSFEVGFPLALTSPARAVAFLAAGLVFHFGSWLAFGLNRFVFAWLAAYPALLYFSAQLAR